MARGGWFKKNQGADAAVAAASAAAEHAEREAAAAAAAEASALRHPRALLPAPKHPALRILVIDAAARPDTTPLANGIARAALVGLEVNDGSSSSSAASGAAGLIAGAAGAGNSAAVGVGRSGALVHVMHWAPDSHFEVSTAP